MWWKGLIGSRSGLYVVSRNLQFQFWSIGHFDHRKPIDWTPILLTQGTGQDAPRFLVLRNGHGAIIHGKEKPLELSWTLWALGHLDGCFLPDLHCFVHIQIQQFFIFGDRRVSEPSTVFKFKVVPAYPVQHTLKQVTSRLYFGIPLISRISRDSHARNLSCGLLGRQ